MNGTNKGIGIGFGLIQGILSVYGLLIIAGGIIGFLMVASFATGQGFRFLLNANVILLGITALGLIVEIAHGLRQGNFKGLAAMLSLTAALCFFVGLIQMLPTSGFVPATIAIGSNAPPVQAAATSMMTQAPAALANIIPWLTALTFGIGAAVRVANAVRDNEESSEA